RGSVQIEYRGVLSDAVSVPLLAARPGIFTSDGSGRGQALARNEDGSVNSGASPAEPGSTVVLLATGEGLTDGPNLDGAITGTPAPGPKLPVTVFFFSDDGDFFRADALSAESVPGLVSGMLQVRVRLPDMHRSWWVHLSIGEEALLPNLGWVSKDVFPV